MFYFPNFIFKGVGTQNIQTSHQGDLRKTRHVKKITPPIHLAHIRKIVVKKMLDAF